MTVLKVQTRAESKKLQPTETIANENPTTNSDIEPDQLKISESLNINEVHDLPKLII